MAYILQHRRDTLANWTSVNPVLANSEIGFILDLDENGKQKSSLYKIGDGSTSWNDLPLFGFGGNVYDTFTGNDLTTSVASRQAVLNKINEITSKVSNDLEDKLINGDSDLEGLINKLSTSQLVQFITPENGEQFGDKIFNSQEEEGLLDMDYLEPYLKNQIVSRWALLLDLQQTWNDFGNMEDRQNEFDTRVNDFKNEYDSFVTLTNSEINVLKEFAETFGEFKSVTETTLESYAVALDTLIKFMEGYDEETGTDEEGQPIITHHKGVDEKISDVNTKVEELKSEFLNKHHVLTEVDFAKLDFSTYPEGTLFYTYKDQQ